VPIPKDERFEQYLKKFRPLAPAPLPVTERIRKSRAWLVPAWATVAAVAAVLLLLHPRPKSVPLPDDTKTVVRVESLHPQLLTIAAANALLARVPSVKAAVDGVAAQAFQSQCIPSSPGMQSALAVLSKEKIKL
jgi:hypothetical protein